MMNTGFHYKGMIPADTTMLAFHPGVYNTKMLLGAYGKVGVDVEEANPTFELATEDKYAAPGEHPKYYAKTVPRKPLKQALDEQACVDFVDYMDEII